MFKPQKRAKKTSRPEGHQAVIERPDMEQINPQRNRITDEKVPPVVVINEKEPLKKTENSKDLIKKQRTSVKNSTGSSSESENDSNSKSENTASITHDPKPPPLPKVSPRPTLSLRGRVSPKPPNDPKPTSPTKLTPEPSTAEVSPPIEQPRGHPPGEGKPVFPVPKSPNNSTIEISDLPTSTNAPVPRQRISQTTSKSTPLDEHDSDAENKPNFKRTSPRITPRKSEPKSPTEKSELKTPNARLGNILTKSKSRSKDTSSSDSEPENKPDGQPKPKVAFKPSGPESPPPKFRPGGRMSRPPVAQNLANKPRRQSSHSSDSEPGNDLSESKIVSKSPQPASAPEEKIRSGGRRSRPRAFGTQNARKSKPTSPSSSDSETEKPKEQNITNFAQAVRIQTEPKSPPRSVLRRTPSKKGPAPNPGEVQLQPRAEKRPLPQPDADPYKDMIRRKSAITPTQIDSKNVPKRPLSSTSDNKPSVKPKPFVKRPTSLSIPPPKSSSSSENESPSGSSVKPAIPKKPTIKKPQSPTQVHFEDGTQTTVSVPSPGENLDRSLSNKYKPPSQKKSDTTTPVLLKVTNKESSRNPPITP